MTIPERSRDNSMKRTTACRMCDSENLHRFLDLGATPPADSFIKYEQLGNPDSSYPLEVLLCEDCGLSQLSVVVSPEILYCDDYPYEASTTKAGREHWREFAATTSRMLELTRDDLVVDIGSNVGVLLQMFHNEGMRVLGVDPAANIAAIAQRNGIDTLTGFFDPTVAAEIVARHGRATVITGTNVFAHIDDLEQFVAATDILLNEKGVLILEMPYFAELLRNLEYDTIYHEHLSYVSVKPSVRFFNRFGMEIFEIQQRDIHGGSFRLFVRRKTSTRGPIGRIVTQLLEMERQNRIHERATVDSFATAVKRNRNDLRRLLLTLKEHGNRIAAVSAPAKGMTLLNYCGIGRDILEFVTEKSSLKIGRFTPGGRIEVVPDERLLRDQPDYALLLAWNFSEEIMNNLKEYSARGGKFIIPIPTPRIVG